MRIPNDFTTPPGEWFIKTVVGGFSVDSIQQVRNYVEGNPHEAVAVYHLQHVIPPREGDEEIVVVNFESEAEQGTGDSISRDEGSSRIPTPPPEEQQKLRCKNCRRGVQRDRKSPTQWVHDIEADGLAECIDEFPTQIILSAVGPSRTEVGENQES